MTLIFLFFWGNFCYEINIKYHAEDYKSNVNPKLRTGWLLVDIDNVNQILLISTLGFVYVYCSRYLNDIFAKN